ncbi:NADH-quinone oxidoreductase subunit J [Halorubrum alkaliphilum]|uniref:NADH-quinone oxidoreductase subunit J n=1 Tax=Halorubrum alkaliphilum TaxID=261290 RepID=A0A8T4GDX5_9EURY|nr:hypothetical protein [Halorubrum alkaliphilum]MBP1921315.1 NADH-quinone oxidoreductase subunit J [Halorubrum alkaliphilum]
MTEDANVSRVLPAAVVTLVFGVMAVTFLGAEFGEFSTFAGESVVHNIGYALFNLTGYEELSTIPSEGFLAAFLIVAVALDVAVDGAIYLAKREEDGSIVAAVGEAFTDGGER